MQKQQVLRAPACAQPECKNFARRGQDTCRWHDPEVLRLRTEAEELRAAALRAAGAA